MALGQQMLLDDMVIWVDLFRVGIGSCSSRYIQIPRKENLMRKIGAFEKLPKMVKILLSILNLQWNLSSRTSV